MNKFNAGQKVTVNSHDGVFKNDAGVVLNSRNDGTVMVNLIQHKAHILFYADELSKDELRCFCGDLAWGSNGCCGTSGCNNVPA